MYEFWFLVFISEEGLVDRTDICPNFVGARFNFMGYIFLSGKWESDKCISYIVNAR